MASFSVRDSVDLPSAFDVAEQTLALETLSSLASRTLLSRLSPTMLLAGHVSVFPASPFRPPTPSVLQGSALSPLLSLQLDDWL